MVVGDGREGAQWGMTVQHALYFKSSINCETGPMPMKSCAVFRENDVASG